MRVLDSALRQVDGAGAVGVRAGACGAPTLPPERLLACGAVCDRVGTLGRATVELFAFPRAGAHGLLPEFTVGVVRLGGSCERALLFATTGGSLRAGAFTLRPPRSAELPSDRVGVLRVTVLSDRSIALGARKGRVVEVVARSVS